MVNYACAFSQWELAKYFEWIINTFSKFNLSYKGLEQELRFPLRPIISLSAEIVILVLLNFKYLTGDKEHYAEVH